MPITRRDALLGLTGSSLAFSLALSPQVAHAQSGTYPAKNIRMIVPYAAGGGTDIMARIIATQLSNTWGVSVVVENKPGASGIPGNDMVAKAAPDGYTVLVGITAMLQTVALYPKLPYDVMKDFAPVSQLALSADFLMVPKDSPANSLQDFIAMAKASPGKYNYGTYGNGTSSHMHGELLKMAAGIELTAVPYKGAAPEINDLLGGQLTAAFVDVTSATPHLKSEKIKILAITGTQRHPSVPDVKTFGELGLGGFEANGWFSVFLPGGTPKPIVDKLSGEIQKIVRSPELNSRLVGMGLKPVGGTPEELAGVMARDLPRWSKIVRDAKITLE